MSLRSARIGLMGNARSFFEGHLRGLFCWDDVVHHKPEALPPLENGRRNPLGRYVERAVMTFGDFELTIDSPEVAPPLGWVTCLHKPSREQCEGPPDTVIWEKIGNFIKAKVEEKVDV